MSEPQTFPGFEHVMNSNDAGSFHPEHHASEPASPKPRIALAQMTEEVGVAPKGINVGFMSEPLTFPGFEHVVLPNEKGPFHPEQQPAATQPPPALAQMTEEVGGAPEGSNVEVVSNGPLTMLTQAAFDANPVNAAAEPEIFASATSADAALLLSMGSKTVHVSDSEPMSTSVVPVHEPMRGNDFGVPPLVPHEVNKCNVHKEVQKWFSMTPTQQPMNFDTGRNAPALYHAARMYNVNPNTLCYTCLIPGCPGYSQCIFESPAFVTILS